MEDKKVVSDKLPTPADGTVSNVSTDPAVKKIETPPPGSCAQMDHWKSNGATLAEGGSKEEKEEY